MNAILAPVRDASCRRPSVLSEDGRDLAPSVEAPQTDLAAGYKAEQEDQRRVLGGQAALGLHPAPELLVEPFNHVCGSERLHWLLGNWKNVSNSSPPSRRLRTTPGQRGVHLRSKAV